MKIRKHALTFAAALLFALPLALHATDSKLQKPIWIEGGLIEGVANAEAVAFKGLPCAAPPVGEWRWREPRLQRFAQKVDRFRQQPEP